MSTLTCLACNVSFDDVVLGRFHYKTDWHRYNLKRKVSNLSPVTLEKFQDRQQLQEKKENSNSTAEETCFCKPCNKSFSTANALENHTRSKKHLEIISGNAKQKKGRKKGTVQKSNAAVSQAQQSVGSSEEKDEAVDIMSQDVDDSEVESWNDENVIGIEECLFCSHICSSVEENITHMSSHHGFFLPDAEYIRDLEGLITYLGEKVGAGHVCLWCNEKGKRFHNKKDVQRHMVDKGHCKLLHEGEDIYEYADFYDYTSSYPDGQNPEVNPDEVVSPLELESDGFSLILPSGALIGHRSLVRYYQQNLTPYLRDPKKKYLPKMLAHYKALGWTGTTGPQAEQRVKDLHFMQRLKKNYYTKLGCNANKLRHRFRDPNP